MAFDDRFWLASGLAVAALALPAQAQPAVDTAAISVRPVQGPLRVVSPGDLASWAEPSIVARSLTAPPHGRPTIFSPNLDRKKRDWLAERAPPPIVFREPFPRRRSIQDSRSEGVGVVIRSTTP